VKNLTTETRRHGEESGDRVIAAHDPKNHCFDAPIARSPDHQITRSSRLFNTWNIFLAALREIFDESAYERFLSRTHSTRSVQSYREFLGEREAVATRPRCC
jgi:hypothetical protein